MERRPNLVFSRNFKLKVKKKGQISLKDQKEWIAYTKEMSDVYDKDFSRERKNATINKIRIIDLHGQSLENANKSVKSFICDSFKKNYSKIKVVTGKGHRSTIKKNPYISSELGILKNSVPEFIKNDKDISDKIYKIYPADQTDGGDGAFYILLKKFKE